jgi:hypothetical protein
MPPAFCSLRGRRKERIGYFGLIYPVASELRPFRLGRNAFSCALLGQLRSGSMIDLSRLFDGGPNIVRRDQEAVLNEPRLNFILGFQPLTM